MKLKPYPKYKNSGIQWIGEIPEEWGVRKLKFNYEIIGKTNIPASEGNEEGKFPFFTSGESIKYIDKSVIKGEYIIVGDGGIPNFKYYKGEFSYSDHCFLLKTNKKTSPKFLYYFLIGNLEALDVLCFQGMGLRNLDKYKFNSFFSNLSPLSEQTAIASFLDKKNAKIDALIEKDKELIALLKEKRTALINHVVTKGLDPGVKLKDSGIEWIGKIPEGWEIDRLKFLVSKINSGVTPSGGAKVYTNEGIPLIRSQNVHFDALRLDDVAYIPEEIHNTMMNAVVKKHDILINITGASIGRCTYVEDEFKKANVNQHVCIVRPNKINYKYLSYYLKSKMGQDQVFSSQMGTSREGLNFEQLSNFIIYHPDLKEQEKAVEYLDKATSKIDKTINKIESKITLMEEYKKSLIHHVVTGKVDVREVAA